MIEIYSTEFCPWCKKAKAHFTELKVEFTDYDVGKDEEKAQELVRKSGQLGVPVIDIKGDIIVGFDKPKIDAALEKHGLIKKAA